jgi:hypothetical protein
MPKVQHKFLLNESKERLKDAPGFEKERWPDMHHRTWGEKIYDC